MTQETDTISEITYHLISDETIKAIKENAVITDRALRHNDHVYNNVMTSLILCELDIDDITPSI